jgi:hypothetical protein
VPCLLTIDQCDSPCIVTERPTRGKKKGKELSMPGSARCISRRTHLAIAPSPRELADLDRLHNGEQGTLICLITGPR